MDYSTDMPCSRPADMLSLGRWRTLWWKIAAVLCTVCLARLVNGAEVPVTEDYNQWKQALGTNSATAAEHIVALAGFGVELVRSAAPGEGSWVALTFDPRG